MKLHTLAPSAGAKKKPKRVGSGPGSGHGKTAPRVHNGMLSRPGGCERRGRHAAMLFDDLVVMARDQAPDTIPNSAVKTLSADGTAS